jgi:uncharacterized membrane protein
VRGLIKTRVTSVRTSAADERSANATVILACSAAMFTLLPVAAHQLGGLRHLPDPPGRLFASDKITESRAAHPFGIPDSVLGLGSYAVTLALALNASRCQGARKALHLKLVADGSVAGVNFARQVISFRRLCSWCAGTALCTVAMLLAERRPIRKQTAVMGTPLCSHED